MTDTPNNVNTDEKTDEEEDKEKDDVSIDEGDKKPAAKPKKSAQDQNKRRFYAIRKSDTLKTPAIFLSWDDASLYLEDQDDTEIPPEYQIFDTLDEATQYIHSFLDTKKRKSAASLPRPAGKKRRIKASEKNNWQSEWMNKFQENWAESSKVFLVKMKQYEEKYGNCDVPVRSAQLEEDCVPLAKWIQKTRQFIKAYNKDPASSFLTEEQVNQLLNAGFPVNVTRGSKPSRSKASVSDKNRKELEETWDEMVEQLKKYKETFGGCDVPKRSKVINEKWQPLGKWVDKVRGYIKKHEEDPDSSILDDERVKELMDLGFVKTTTRGKKAQGSASETENFEKYLEIHKQVLEEKIPVKSNLKLQNWVMKQRKEYQKFKDGQPSTMTAERLVRLTEAGFVFHPKQKMTWEERALSWLAYKTKHGTDPKRYSEDGLGKWILTQRTKYVMFKTGEKTNLTQDQIKRLTDWGFAWESKIKKPLKRADPLPWAERFKQLIRYRKIHGHTLVPQHYPELGQWVHSQRGDYRKFIRGEKSKMTAEKLGKLNSNGFIFYSGKGGGKRTADNQSQEQLPNPPAPPDFNGEDTKEETANNSLSAAAAGGGGGLNSQNQAASRFWPQGMNAAGVPAGTSIDFATWSRYRMGRHKT